MSNWYLQNGKESDVVMSTRVRLARNIDGYSFVNKSTKSDRNKIINKIEEILPNIGYDLKLLKLNDMDNVTKKSLVEKNVISPEFALKEGEGYAILINKEENICIMINEEDHLIIQVFSEGLEIESSLALAIELDNKIGKLLKYAYNSKYGYLTACPTNVGTAVRISTMLHLPALSKTENVSKILMIASNFGINIRGSYGEGTESEGAVYQISNKQTLGITENDISKSIKTVTEKIITQERAARTSLGKTGIRLENKLYRSFGILTCSKILTSNECRELLSDVKLGTDMGIIKELDDKKIKELWLYTKPANLQKFYGQTYNKEERSIKRAELIKNIVYKS